MSDPKSSKGRTPDFQLGAMDKRNSAKSSKLGAAWKNTNGSITLLLNPCVKLEYDPDILLTLWPHKPYDHSDEFAPRQAETEPQPETANDKPTGSTKSPF